MGWVGRGGNDEARDVVGRAGGIGSVHKEARNLKGGMMVVRGRKRRLAANKTRHGRWTENVPESVTGHDQSVVGWERVDSVEGRRRRDGRFEGKVAQGTGNAQHAADPALVVDIRVVAHDPGTFLQRVGRVVTGELCGRTRIRR